ncbi:hypothetical protein [Intestinirhabdus alba]|jgi:hypothetical protein|uniref:Uncharacterized protein n=1 Tax=Intestinirhabdus alba TaxID=2899544 RepID=A0A6L6IFY0_9ENTR|nr:hypothetical protein [Intestinirhabdus alba]MTH44807.1 hypothetical protein [Intestinirhabdus alba]
MNQNGDRLAGFAPGNLKFSVTPRELSDVTVRRRPLPRYGPSGGRALL